MLRFSTPVPTIRGLIVLSCARTLFSQQKDKIVPSYLKPSEMNEDSSTVAKIETIELFSQLSQRVRCWKNTCDKIQQRVVQQLGNNLDEKHKEKLKARTQENVI